VLDNPQHTFLVLTKNPRMLLDKIVESPYVFQWDYALPSNLWIGVSVSDRKALSLLEELNGYVGEIPGEWHVWVSFEPVHGDILERDFHNPMFRMLEWIVVGAETGNRKGKVIPEENWIKDLVRLGLIHNIPVFVKDNAEGFIPKTYRLKDFPKSMGVGRR